MNLLKKIFKAAGWNAKFECEIPEKCIICVAPHTSNWDFVIGVLFKQAYKLKANFFIKKEWFNFPTGKLFRKLGGVPIWRDKEYSTTDLMAKAFEERETMRLAITPEGTRKLNQQWKLGFYYIALKARVPIVLAGIDYATKNIIIGKLFTPSGNVESDLIEIKLFYKNFTAKFPHKFGY
ncbi:MAG: 1-acyl-sn-glycerol-3-phosphate acyltransferase [Prevotellaceae bacterium]|nr:1-acyl-sn-glycerol-3-phosphate acyltransferase [Prevotellaceae bacterium]